MGVKSKSSLKPFSTRFTGKHLTSHAGLALLHRFWNNLNGEAWIEQNLDGLKADNAVYSVSRIITILLMGFIRGAKHISHLNQLGQDKGLTTLWDWVRFPVETTITRTLNLFGFVQVVRLADLMQTLRQKVWDQKWRGRVTLDFDSTVRTVYGHQEGAAKGYNPFHKGKFSYNPSLVFIAETAEVLLGWLRPGDTFSANGSIEFAKEAFARLPKQIWKIVVRADAAFFNASFLDYLEQKRCLYVVKCKIKNYRSLAEKNAHWRQSGVNRWTASFMVQLPGWKRSRRFVAVRILEGYSDPDNMFGPVPVYQYQLWVTNMDKSSNQLENFYNQRATSENYFAQGKGQMGWAGVLTDKFWTNDALFQLGLLAYNLVVWFKQRYLPEGDRGQEVETFRSRLINVAGHIIHTGHQWFIDLGSDYPWKGLWQSIEVRQLSVQPF